MSLCSSCTTVFIRSVTPIGNYTPTINITDLILAVVQLLERDINRLVVEARDALKLVKP